LEHEYRKEKKEYSREKEEVVIWDGSTGEILIGPTQYNYFTRNIRFSKNGKYLLADGIDQGEVSWFGVYDKNQAGVISYNSTQSPYLNTEIDSAGTFVAYSRNDSTMSIVDLLNGKQFERRLAGHEGLVNEITFSYDNRIVATASAPYGTIRLWSTETQSQIGKPLYGHDALLRSLSFDSKGELLASGDITGSFIVWDIKNETTVLKADKTHRRPVGALKFTPDSAVLASGDYDNVIQLRNVESGAMIGEPIQAGFDSINKLKFSSNSEFLLLEPFGDRSKILWDLNNGIPIDIVPPGVNVVGAEFSPDAKLIAVFSENEIWILDILSRSSAYEPLRGHTGKILSVEFSSDGETISSIAEDGSFRLWDVGTGTALGDNFHDTEGQITSIKYNDAGDKVVTNGTGGISLWDFDFETRACNIAARNLTCMEWQRYLGNLTYKAACPEYNNPTECQSPPK